MRGKLSMALSLTTATGALLAGCVPAPGRAEAPGAAPPLVRSLPAESTARQAGQNGYAELALAAALADRSKLAAAAASSGATLAQKRAALSDPDCRRALQLMRDGLQKPVRPPRASINLDTPFPELPAFSQLAWLLQTEIYVRAADGQTSAAVDCARDGMRLGYIIQVASPTSGGWVGRAVIRQTLDALARRLDQLSAADCDHLYLVCTDWLAQPSPAGIEIQAEWQADLEALSRVRAHPDLLLDWWPSEVAGAGAPERELAESGRQDPQAFLAVIDAAERIADRYFQQVLGQLSRPAWERSTVSLPKDPSPAARLVASLCYGDKVGRTAEQYVADQAGVRLLACHAAIRRHRWEFGRLPTTLDQLHLGALCTDPFTGRPFRYVVRDQDYDIESVGPTARQGAPLARSPIVLNTR